MFARQLDATARTCPDCGSLLASERELFRCAEHGAFFTYGPRLLVRVPQAAAKPPTPVLPWENQSMRRPH